MQASSKILLAAVMVAVIVAVSLWIIMVAGIRTSDDRVAEPVALQLPPPAAEHVYSTALSEWHRIGRADGVGWSVSAKDGQGHMNYGPYTQGIAPGPAVATFRIMIDEVRGDDRQVAVLDINNSNADKVIATVVLTRHQFKKGMAYEDFDLPFVAPEHGSLEFRTYSFGVCYINQQNVIVRGR